MIRYEGFTKAYAARTVVDDLSIAVAAGEVVALLGPNGSGKTTSIKAAAGLVAPTAGRVLVGPDAGDARTPASRDVVSFLPQRVTFPDTLTGREVVEFYRRLRRRPTTTVDDALAFASLNGASRRPVGTYSGGMVQRLGLAVASVADAGVLLLDEPTAALDPDGLQAFYALVEARRRAGGAVLFSSHQLGDVERLADRVAVLVHGRLVADLGARELAARLADRGVMRVRLTTPPAALPQALLDASPGAHWDGDELVLPGPAAARPLLLARLRDAGLEVRSLTADEGHLDVFYRDLVGGQP